MKINLQKEIIFLVTLLFLSSSFVFNWAHEQLKKLRFWKGLVTGQNIGSLLLFFAYGGLPRGKKFRRIWTGASVKTKYVLYFWWEEINCRIFPAKRLGIFSDQHKTQFKSADLFFSRDIFPAKRLNFFRKYFSVFWAIPKKCFNYRRDKSFLFLLANMWFAPSKARVFTPT